VIVATGARTIAAGAIAGVGVAAMLTPLMRSILFEVAPFDPVTAYREVDAVAIRYPDPNVSYATPAFAAGKQDFTSQDEMMAYLRQLAGRAPSMRLDLGARSQQGRELPIMLFSRVAS